MEADYKPQLHDKIRELFPGCVILFNDAEHQQGIPDTLVLYREKWAMLEVKRTTPTRKSDFRPNQPWWIEMLNEMSYAACVYPENEKEVLDDLQRLFACEGQACHAES